MNRLSNSILSTLAAFVVAPVAFAEDPVPTPTPVEYTRQFMTGEDFLDASLVSGKFFQVRLNGASFKGAQLEGATFEQCDLSTANFEGAEFNDKTKFYKVMMNDANLSNADFGQATFDSVNLRGANLQNTKNYGPLNRVAFDDADLRGADMSGVPKTPEDSEWKGAIYNAETKFPPGIDPTKVGAIEAKE